MACAACAVSVQSMLQSQEGVISASVNYGNKTVRLEYDQEQVSLNSLKKLIQSIGYDLFLDEEDRAEKLEQMENARYRQLSRKLWIAVVFSVPVFVISMFFHHAFPYQNYLLLLLSLPVILYPGSEFYPTAYRQLRHGVFAMDSLVATGTGSAFLFSVFNTFFPNVLMSRGIEPSVYYESAVIIIAFILLGRFLEERAKKSASSSIRKLSGLQPKSIQVERDGESFELPTALVIPGDRVTIKAGDKIPVDGFILSGTSMVDESSITGEPLPVMKESGNNVFAGTVNKQGVLIVEAAKAGNETLLSAIIRMVDEAQSSKPPIQKLVDKIAQVFVPVVFVLALLTFSGWLLFGGSLSHAVVATISVLIIACPCALGLATPTALIAGIGRGASEGILIRNASTLEIAERVNAILLDKTGTLTEGKPSVKTMEWIRPATDEQKKVLFAIESLSNHPLAEAIRNYLISGASISPGDALPTFSAFQEIAGYGIQAEWDQKKYLVGNSSFLKKAGIADVAPATIETGASVVYFASDQELIARISISDEIRPDSKAVIGDFIAQGIEVVMVSGDNESSARSIADQLGITKVFAQVLPDEKGLHVKELQEDGKTVAMIGDGINDAYALAQADIGIAMGNGTDVAIESAGIVLMRSELKNASKSIRLSRSVLKIIRQNLFWAFFYNLVAIPLAAGLLYPLTGHMLSPMIAGAAMAMSSVTVVTNSLRLRKMKI